MPNTLTPTKIDGCPDLRSLGLRLSEGLSLQIQDIDAARGRVHIHQSKNRKDRLVPLPAVTLDLLRRFLTWSPLKMAAHEPLKFTRCVGTH